MLRRILLPLLLLSGTIGFLTPIAHADTYDTPLQAVPASTNLQVGDTISVNVFVDADTASYQRANFAYDYNDSTSAGLQFVDVDTSGSDFDTPGSGGLEPAAGTDTNSDAQCLYIDRSSSLPLSGKHLLGSFTFKAVKAGNFQLAENTTSCGSTIYGTDGTTVVRGTDTLPTNTVNISVAADNDNTGNPAPTSTTSGNSTATPSNPSAASSAAQAVKPHLEASALPTIAAANANQPQLPPPTLSPHFKTVAATTMGVLGALLLLAAWASRHILAYPLLKKVAVRTTQRLSR